MTTPLVRIVLLAVAASASAGPGAALAADEPASAASSASAATAGVGVYDFQASLDGKPIGRHRFSVNADAGGRTVDSQADFDVRFLGFKAYHYQHHASEQWQGDCLQSLSASTDDDGKPGTVEVRRAGDDTTVKVGAAQRTETGCLMTFAYWNPAMRQQARLLNPQTGKLESVKVETLADGPIQVGGQAVQARHYRISGPEQPIELWISPQGRWIGLDSVVGKNHHLSYRLP